MLEVRIENKAGLLTLNHEDRGNSFGLEEAEALNKALEDKKLEGLIMTGCGSRFFCTGGNLAEQSRAKTPKLSLAHQKKIRATLDKLAKWPRPTVALINGDCFGGGTELLSAFDCVITAPHVFFGFWQRKLGLSYGWGGGARLSQRLGHRLNKRALDTQVFGAFEARDIGLADAIVPAQDLELRGFEWIAKVLNLRSFAEIKSWDTKNESRLFDKLWMNPLHREVIAKHLK